METIFLHVQLVDQFTLNVWLPVSNTFLSRLASSLLFTCTTWMGADDSHAVVFEVKQDDCYPSKMEKFALLKNFC